MLTAERLRELLNYDPSTGHFFWVRPQSNRAKAGARAGHGCKTHGYWIVGVDGSSYRAHRLAWLFVHGKWPEYEVDHLNAVRDDNRIANLRDVPAAINAQNKRRATQNKKHTKLAGAFKNHVGFMAKITTKGVQKYLGNFPTAELAHEAYLTAKRAMHEGCTV